MEHEHPARLMARGEVPVCVGLRLFLPKGWEQDAARRKKCKIPVEVEHRPKWRIALEEVDRLLAQGVQFDAVLADAGYGHSPAFRHGLSERRLRWAVGVESDLKVYSAAVEVRAPAARRERPVAGGIRRCARARGRRSENRARPAVARRSGVAGLRAANERREKILSF
jgi:SRSO17 transposase